MKKLSVTLAVYNEGNSLDTCLNSIKDLADEIVIVDGTSADNSVAIARKYNSKVLITTNKQNFHINKKKANDMVTSEWILQLDADEVVSPELEKEVRETVYGNPVENGFWIPRKNYFLGRFLTKGGTYPDYTLRLYRRGKGNLPAKSVHEQAAVEGSIGYLNNNLLHYSNHTFGEYIDKRFNRYSDLMAKEVNGGMFVYFFWRPLFDPLQGFVPVYFRHLGFLDGFPGFIWALFQSLLFPIAYLKSVEKRK